MINYRLIFLLLFCYQPASEPHAAAPGAPPKEKVKRNLDGVLWTWTGGSCLLESAQGHLDDYQVEIRKPKGFGVNVILRILDGDEEVYKKELAPSCVFTRIGSVIYVADFSPRRSGCTVHALDLKLKKEIWKTRLKGIGPVAHSVYSNSVVISERELDGVIEVKGNEASGNYIELLDAKTGERLDNKVYE